MEVLKIVGMILFGAAGGALTAAGFFAVVTSIGLINRVAEVTKTAKNLLLYEEFIIAGAIVGNILSLFDIVLPFGGWVLSFGENAWTISCAQVILVVFGLMSGIFVGLFVVCLAETTKVLPIFLRRVRIGAGLGIIILMIGLGKAVGQLIYELVLYK